MSTLKVNNIADLGDDAIVTSGVLDTLAVPAGGILQVVSTTKTDTFSATTGGYPVDLPGASLSITPSSTSSKILVIFDVPVGVNSGGTVIVKVLRDSIAIGEGDAAGSRQTAMSKFYLSGNGTSGQASGNFLDSPNTTSSITYKLQIASAGTLYVGRDSVDVDSNGTQQARTPCTITAIEVAG